MNDEDVTFPEQVIRDTAKKLRAALKQAAKQIGHTNLQRLWPLQSIGKGEYLTYSLAPELFSIDIQIERNLFTPPVPIYRVRVQ